MLGDNAVSKKNLVYRNTHLNWPLHRLRSKQCERYINTHHCMIVSSHPAIRVDGMPSLNKSVPAIILFEADLRPTNIAMDIEVVS